MKFPIKGLINTISPTSDLDDKAQEIYQNSEQKYIEMENTGKIKRQKRSIQGGPKLQLNKNSRVREQRQRKEENN